MCPARTVLVKPGKIAWVFRMADTVSPEYLAALRRMSGAEKLRTAFGLYWEARKLKAARLRKVHPEWSEEQVQARVREIFLHVVT